MFKKLLAGLLAASSVSYTHLPLERFLTVNQGRNLLKPDDVRRVE